jgi:hypothetical protein
MKALGPILGVMLLLAVGMAYAADLQKGEAAYVRGDYAAALAEFRPLAEQGNADAQQELGAMYSHGEGVPQDYAQAIAWVRKSAAQGAYGQLALAWMYHDGVGVRKNIIAAYALANLSAAAIDFSAAQSAPGSHVGSTSRNELIEEMSPAQIEAGQALTREMQRVGVLQALDAR